jgi:hypothetical protein
MITGGARVGGERDASMSCQGMAGMVSRSLKRRRAR